MIPQITIQLDREVVEAIYGDKSNKVELLFSDLNRHSSLAEMLHGLPCFFQDTNGEVHEVEIEEDTLIVDLNGIGSFWANFNVLYYFSCDDLNKQKEERMLMNFTIDKNTREIHIEGEKCHEREPDGY